MLAVDLVTPGLAELVVHRHEFLVEAERLLLLLFLALLGMTLAAGNFLEVDRRNSAFFALGGDVRLLGHRF